ncbi:uncharacterized protein LOC116296246 isoform X2 [Actinia tenebrosa]|uniref:Uncharacterized protein LOC116296246 isoform X2 n=1 Tax=Actinia tenebrosa TaxID=6105 RepID=A0A6P8HXH1_ACTTE|nr:uncharacterized protein LOC116296246 isoform X2 [Actinia tenebrosa]
MVHKFSIMLCFLLIIQDCKCKSIEIVVDKCGIESIKVKRRDGDIIGCMPCEPCPAGQRPYFPCGSIIFIKDMFKSRCSPCPNGTYSDSYSRSSCTRCKRCERGLVVSRKCSPTTDTQCIPRMSHCKKGFYFSEIVLECLPCSSCCDDGKDIKIDECATQGSQSKKLCSVHSFHRCLKNVDNENATQSVEKRLPYDFPTTKLFATKTGSNIFGISNRTHARNENKQSRKHGWKELDIYLFLVISLCTLMIFITLGFIIKRTRKNSGAQCFQIPPMRLSKRIDIPDRCKSDQSDELEDWSKNDVNIGKYSFTCGVVIKYDPDCKQDRYKNLIVEPLSDKHLNGNFKSIKQGQLFLSPIYRFYSKGEKFEELVKISLPHSALWNSEHKNWDIDVLCMDERKGIKEAKWERITDGLEVNWKDVSFHTDTLLTYAVVGKPLKGAKKRMQFVLFTTSEMISDLFEVCIHLLDDDETSFQNVLKENSLKGFSMLGSFYAAFVDCHSSVDINLNVEGLLDGWELDRLSPKAISSSICKESYFCIPSFQAVFRRVKRRAEKFSCKFKINVAESEIIIPAFTFVPEEDLCVVVDVHEQDQDTSFLKEKKTLFKDLHYDTKYVAGRMLDVSVKGQGTWRQLGRHFGLTDDVIEQFSVEYRTLEGSPSRALFEYLSSTHPSITVGEFAKCLESLGREDVMVLLYKHLKTKKPLNTEI